MSVASVQRAVSLMRSWVTSHPRAKEAIARGWELRLLEEELLLRDDFRLALDVYRPGRERATWRSTTRLVQPRKHNETTESLVSYLRGVLDTMVLSVLETAIPAFKPKGWRLYSRRRTS